MECDNGIYDTFFRWEDEKSLARKSITSLLRIFLTVVFEPLMDCSVTKRYSLFLLFVVIVVSVSVLQLSLSTR